MKLLFLFLFLFTPCLVNATTAMSWNGEPLDIMLKIGTERIVRFDDNVQFRLPKEAMKYLNISTTAGIVYITAKKSLVKVPLDIRLTSTGEFIKIRLTATDDNTRLDEIKILPFKKKQNLNVDSRNNNLGDPVALIRYAAIRNIMPKRLWSNNPYITEMQIPKYLNIDQLLIGKSAGKLKMKIIAQYKSGNLYLTAISLKNKTAYPFSLDFRDISIQTSYIATPKPYYTLAEKDNIDSKDFGVLYILTKGDFTPHMLDIDPNALSIKEES